MSHNDDIRLPPQNLDAERGVLGSLMLMSSAIDEIASIITPNDFYSDAHGKAYAAIGDMHRRGCRAIDPVTLSEELIRRAEFEDIGGAGYIAQIVEAVPHAAHVRYDANIVREKSRMRKLIYLCSETLQRAYEATTDTDELIAELDSRTLL